MYTWIIDECLTLTLSKGKLSEYSSLCWWGGGGVWGLASWIRKNIFGEYRLKGEEGRKCSTLQEVIYKISETSDGADITEFWHEISGKKYDCKKNITEISWTNFVISAPSDFSKISELFLRRIKNIYKLNFIYNISMIAIGPCDRPIWIYEQEIRTYINYYYYYYYFFYRRFALEC